MFKFSVVGFVWWVLVGVFFGFGGFGFWFVFLGGVGVFWFLGFFGIGQLICLMKSLKHAMQVF